MGKLNPKGLKALIKKPPRRYPDGDGLFFKVAGQGKAYWTYRYTVGGKETETSLGPYPEMSLDEAQIKHLELRAAVRKKIDPLRDKHAAKAAVTDNTGTPTFGECADAYLRAHDPSWRNPKHAQQWAMTLTKYCASIRATPVDQVDANAVRRVLEPIWTKTPETASRLRGRIEAVLASAQVAGHIDADRPNPARWKGWLDHMLPPPKKIGSRGHHAALAYDQLPAFMAKLGEMPGVASRALMFTVLTACRTGEVLDMPWNEINLDAAAWIIPKERMKMAREHTVPLSDQALAILRAQEAERGKNPFVFPGRPQRPLSNMSMAMLLRRMNIDATVHGMRAAFRMWAADQGVAFEVAEQCLAHVVGNAVVQAYQRSSMLERRRPIMSAWGSFVTGSDASNVIPLHAHEHA